MARYTEKKHVRSSGSFVTGHDESIGRGSPANMPQEVIMKQYPASATYGPSFYDDSMTNIDDVNHDAVRTARKHISYQK